MEIENKNEVVGKSDIWLGELERTPGFLLRIAQVTTYENFFRHLSDFPHKLSEQTILQAVHETPGVQQGVIADVLKITPSLMTRLVRGLEDRGLLERVVPRQNRRAVQLHLTPAGEELLNGLKARVREANRQSMKMLSGHEQRQLVRLLRKVAGWKPLDEEHS